MTRIENEWRYFDNAFDMPYPWYTRPCIEWLLTLDLEGKDIWEYGVGDSTRWYQAKGCDTFGVDHDPAWVSMKMGEDFSCAYHITSQKERYIYPFDHLEYDIIVIDGLFRDDCTEPALKQLKSGGFLIIDNYKQASAELAAWPLTEKLLWHMDVKEFKEPGHKDWITIVVQKP